MVDYRNPGNPGNSHEKNDLPDRPDDDQFHLLARKTAAGELLRDREKRRAPEGTGRLKVTLARSDVDDQTWKMANEGDTIELVVGVEILKKTARGLDVRIVDTHYYEGEQQEPMPEGAEPPAGPGVAPRDTPAAMAGPRMGAGPMMQGGINAT